LIEKLIMKTNKLLSLALVATGLLIANRAQSQDQVATVIKGSAQDASTLMTGYVGPALSIVGYGLNQGWYNTAKPHKLAGVDITATISAISVPTSGLTYYVDNSKLNNLELLNTSGGTATNGNVPTIFGKDEQPTYKIVSTGTEFPGAQGINLKKAMPVMSNSLPVPMAQLGFGLPKGFELKARFVPTISFGDNKQSNFGMWGVGLMHDVKQYIPGIKFLPFDLSGFVGYTHLNFNSTFDATHNQKGKMTSNAFTIQAVISKKISVLTGYAGIGYNIASTKASINGDYNLNNDGATYTAVPLNMSASSNGPRATVGLRLKLAVFTLHGEYTIQKYNSLSLGFGISVR